MPVRRSNPFRFPPKAPPHLPGEGLFVFQGVLHWQLVMLLPRIAVVMLPTQKEGNYISWCKTTQTVLFIIHPVRMRKSEMSFMWVFCRIGLCPCRFGRLVGNLLCRMGLHKWRWQDMRRHALYCNQVKRCEREGCTRVKHRTIYPKE